jgi:hypothetical protein
MAGGISGTGDDYPDRVEIGGEVMTRIPGHRSQYRRDGRGRWELLGGVGLFVRLPDAEDERNPPGHGRPRGRHAPTGGGAEPLARHERVD